MKRCPECRRDYFDDSLLYCLEDGSVLVQGSVASPDAPPTAIMHGTIYPNEAGTRPQMDTTEQTMVLPAGAETEPQGSLKSGPERQSLSAHRAAKPLLITLVLAGIVLSGFFGYRYLTATDQITSIAVMPFVNESVNEDVEYLSDGIAESLINSLTEIEQLKVIARTTAFRFKGKEIDPQTVGKELNVRAILMGRVRQTGDQLNIQVDLIDTSNGGQLWGKEYQRPIADVLNIKQAIAKEVTENLRLRLVGEQREKLNASERTNAEAYQAYLRGRFYWNKRTLEGFRKAIEEFRESIEKDPAYAPAYAGLADSYLLMGDFANLPMSEVLPQAKAAAEKALQIDGSLAEAHTSLGMIYTKEWQWDKAEASYKKAIELNPNYPIAHHWLAGYYLSKGQAVEALEEVRRAYELDPLSSLLGHNYAYNLLLNDRVDEAFQQAKKVVEIEPDNFIAHRALGMAYLRQKRNEEALGELQKAVELSGGRDDYTLAELGYFYAVTGDRDKAVELAKELEERYSRREAKGVWIAMIYAALDEKDKAFALLEKEFQAHNELLTRIVWFHYDNLRSDPRYADLRKRMGLQP